MRFAALILVAALTATANGQEIATGELKFNSGKASSRCTKAGRATPTVLAACGSAI